MKAITVEPRKPGSARFEDVPEPEVREGSVLVEAVAVGVGGTNVEIAEGKYGWAPRATRDSCSATSPWAGSWIPARAAG
jgi:NADPH:quinone reductase-like Zn-dependent oxidoreductase